MTESASSPGFSSQTVPTDDRSAVAAAASWLGMLFIVVLAVFVLGALGRLTGASVALPGWPLDGGALLPPFSTAGWEQRHQALLARGGVPPMDVAEFRNLFLLTFAHRALAIVALVVAGCLHLATYGASPSCVAW